MSRVRFIAIAILLAACTPVKHGAPTSAGDVDPLRREVVDDVAALMEQEFDPSVVVLRPRVRAGALHNALMAGLRARGFRVQPSHPGAQAFDCAAIPIGAGQYLIEVVVGPVRFSRLWAVDGRRAQAAGAWARRE